MISEHLQLELQQHLQEHPWLSNMGLSPFTTLCCGRLFEWLETDVDPSHPVLHIGSPAGEEIADVLAIAAAAYATKRAWLDYTESEYPTFRNGDLIRIEIAGLHLDAYYKSFNRRDPANRRVVISKTPRDGAESWEIPVAPSMLRRSPANEGTIGGRGNPFAEFQRHACAHFRNPKLDRFLDHNGTRGLCLDEARQQVLLQTSSGGGFSSIAKALQYEGVNMDELLNLDRSGILRFKKSFDKCIPAEGADIRENIEQELLPLMEQCGIDTQASRLTLQGLSNAGLQPWLTEQDALATERGSNIETAVKDVTKDLRRRLMKTPDDLFHPQRTLCIICKGYDPLLETTNGFERLLHHGARIIIVGDPFHLAARSAWRNQDLPPLFQERCGRFHSIGFPVMKDSIAADHTHQDVAVVDNLRHSQTSIHLVTLSGKGPEHTFFSARARLLDAMIQIPRDDLRRIVNAGLMPVMRTLSMLPMELSGPTKDWVLRTMQEARDKTVAFRSQLPEALREILEECMNAIEHVIEFMIEWDGQKGQHVDGLNEYLYHDYDTGSISTVQLPWWIQNGAELPVEDGEDDRPCVALTGWNGWRAEHWIHRHIIDHKLRSIRIVGYESAIQKWRSSLSGLYRTGVPGLWEGMVANELRDWSPILLSETRVEVTPVLIPEFTGQAIHGDETADSGLGDDTVRERQALRVRPRSTGDGERTMTAAICVQFSDGSYMLHPEEGHLELFGIREGGLVMIKPDDLDSGVELVWVERINELLLSRALSQLSQTEQNDLYAWRDPLKQVLRDRYRNDRTAMARAMEQFGFNEASVNLGRWLYGDMYAPQDANIERILRFCKGPGYPEEEIKRLTKNIHDANGMARDKRRRAKDEVIAELTRQNILADLRLQGKHATTLFTRKVIVTLHHVDDCWTENGAFSQADMYTIMGT